jgi:thioredoxin 1
MIKNISGTEEFEKIITNNKKVLIDFWAPWCGPCKHVGYMLDQIDTKDVVIAKVNIDEVENRSLTEKFKINSIPHLNLYIDGNVANTLIGITSKSNLEKFIAQQ